MANSPDNTDILSQILRSIRLRGGVFFCSKLAAPWGMTLQAAQQPRFHIVLEGRCYLQADEMAAPVVLRSGDFVLLTRGSAHWIADSATSDRIASEAAVAAHQRGTPLFKGSAISTRLLCGRFDFETRLPHPLIATLPAIICSTDVDRTQRDWLQESARLIGREFEQREAGSDVLIDRICEALFVQMLRHHRTLSGVQSGFLSALHDSVLQRALQFLHNDLAADWTVERLALQCNTSRSAFAARFQQKIGMPPMAYLTMWRMQNALALLRDTPLSLAQIAEHLGYSSDMALAKAFKRYFGETPGDMRKAMRERFLLQSVASEQAVKITGT